MVPSSSGPPSVPPGPRKDSGAIGGDIFLRWVVLDRLERKKTSSSKRTIVKPATPPTTPPTTVPTGGLLLFELPPELLVGVGDGLLPAAVGAPAPAPPSPIPVAEPLAEADGKEVEDAAKDVVFEEREVEGLGEVENVVGIGEELEVKRLLVNDELGVLVDDREVEFKLDVPKLIDVGPEEGELETIAKVPKKQLA